MYMVMEGENIASLQQTNIASYKLYCMHSCIRCVRTLYWQLCNKSHAITSTPEMYKSL